MDALIVAKAIINILLVSHPLVQCKLMRVLVIQLTSLFDFLTALLEYLDLEDVRLCSLFSKSEGTPASQVPISYL